MLLQKYPTYDFSKHIIYAAINNCAYDGQLEGDRAQYIWQFIALSDQKDEIVAAVLKALGREREDTWSLDQLFYLALIFAQEGNQRARRAIYKRYFKKQIFASDWCGEEAILKLDGIEGLKFIAETRGKALLNDPERWDDHFTVNQFQEDNPTINVHHELRKASRSNIYIKKYLDEVIEFKDRWKSEGRNRGKSDANYQRVKGLIDEGRGFFAFCKGLSRTDFKKLARDFLSETAPTKLEKYLTLFLRRKFPYDYRRLLELATGREPRSAELVWRACRALKYFEGADIRQFAINKLNTTSTPHIYLPLLLSNYRRGDSKLIVNLVSRFKNKEILHELARYCVEIYDEHSTRQCREPLEILYEKTTCGICRHDIVKILYKNGVLSKRIRREIEFDSYDETRAFFVKVQASQE